MRRFYIASAAVLLVMFAICGIGCSRQSRSDLLRSVPQDAKWVFVCDGAALYEKAGGASLQEVLGERDFSRLSLVKKCIDPRTIVVYQEMEDDLLVATAKVTDLSALKDLLTSSSFSITQEGELFSTVIDGSKLFFCEKQVWITDANHPDKVITDAYERAKNKKAASFALSKGIDKMFEGDCGFFINPSGEVSEVKEHMDSEEEIKKLSEMRIVGNARFEAKEIKLAYEVIASDGKPYDNAFASPAKIDKDVLKYFPKATDIFAICGIRGKDMQEAFDKLPSSWRTPELQSLWKHLDGTMALGVKMNEEDLYDFESVVLLSQVTKGKEKEVQQALLGLLQVKPEDVVYVGNNATFQSFLFGTVVVGIVDGIVYISSSAIDEFKPSYAENELSTMLKGNKGYMLIDLRKDSFFNRQIKESSWGEFYPLDGFIAFSGENNNGEIVFLNKAAVDKNILQGLVRAIAKSNASKEEDLESEEEQSGEAVHNSSFLR